MTKRASSTLLLPVRLAKRILSKAVITAARSGVFIASPQKNSIFISELTSALRAEGVNVLHINLSIDAHKCAGLRISEAVREAFFRDEKCTSSFIMGGNSRHPFRPSISNEEDIGTSSKVDLSTDLAALSEASSRLTVIVIENVHLALSSPDGIATLCALKAARDELNSSKHNGLRVVGFSPYETEIAILCQEEGQAFFGAPMIKLPIE